MPMTAATHGRLKSAGAKAGITVSISPTQIGAARPAHANLPSLMQTIYSTEDLKKMCLMSSDELRKWLIVTNSDIQKDIYQNLMTFNPSAWLNSTHVNTFLALLQSQQSPISVLCINSYFVAMVCRGDNFAALKRWKVVTDCWASKDFVILPVHKTVMVGKSAKGIHWALAVAKPKEHKLAYYDSMGCQKSTDEPTVQKIAQFLTRKGREQSFDSELCSKEWTVEYIGPPFIPDQTDGNSCGKFICAYAGLICAGIPLTNSFVQNELRQFGMDMRQHMQYLAKRACRSGQF